MTKIHSLVATAGDPRRIVSPYDGAPEEYSTGMMTLRRFAEREDRAMLTRHPRGFYRSPFPSDFLPSVLVGKAARVWVGRTANNGVALVGEHGRLVRAFYETGEGELYHFDELDPATQRRVLRVYKLAHPYEGLTAAERRQVSAALEAEKAAAHLADYLTAWDASVPARTAQERR